MRADGVIVEDKGSLTHFVTTRWSLIRQRQAPGTRSRVDPGLSQLCQIYWRPIFTFIYRRGYPIPDALLNRDYSQPHELNAELVHVFADVYNDPEHQWDVYETCEELVDIEDTFQTWRFRHLKTVERIIGYKKGTGGSSGVAFLTRALSLTFFPELFAVRTEIGNS